MEYISAGEVVETTIYPFKGMQGVDLEELNIRSISAGGDRTRRFDIADTPATPTFLDTTKFPQLLEYKPYLVDPTNPKDSPVRVVTPDGKDYSADGQELLKEISERCGRRLVVVRMGRGSYHSMPISLLSLDSIAAIAPSPDTVVDPRRFRANVLVRTYGDGSFQEDGWVGKVIKFGQEADNAKLIALKLDKRCATVNMDPETGHQDPRILRSIVRDHKKTLGIYCAVAKEGVVRRGSQIILADLP